MVAEMTKKDLVKLLNDNLNAGQIKAIDIETYQKLFSYKDLRERIKKEIAIIGVTTLVDLVFGCDNKKDRDYHYNTYVNLLKGLSVQKLEGKKIYIHSMMLLRTEIKNLIDRFNSL